MDPEEMAKHILKNYDQETEPDAMIAAIAHAIDMFQRPARKSVATMREIMTDITFQLEVTKGGYFIYRFDQETMRRIADTLGIEQANAGWYELPPPRP